MLTCYNNSESTREKKKKKRTKILHVYYYYLTPGEVKGQIKQRQTGETSASIFLHRAYTYVLCKRQLHTSNARRLRTVCAGLNNIQIYYGSGISRD